MAIFEGLHDIRRASGCGVVRSTAAFIRPRASAARAASHQVLQTAVPHIVHINSHLRSERSEEENAGTQRGGA
jgi:hypothetical protein